MQVTISQWQGREFVSLSGEASPNVPADQGMRDLLARFDAELRRTGLSLDDTVRTRLWARDRDSRDKASAARLKVLSGPARSSSSSFISEGYFESDANVALQLWALAPAGPAAKTVQEYDPPRSPLRYMTWDSTVFLSGVTSEGTTLEEQLSSILTTIEQTLEAAGTSWSRVVRASCFLKRGADIDLVTRGLGAELPYEVEYSYVDGFAGLSGLIEIEITALK